MSRPGFQQIRDRCCIIADAHFQKAKSTWSVHKLTPEETHSTEIWQEQSKLREREQMEQSIELKRLQRMWL